MKRLTLLIFILFLAQYACNFPGGNPFAPPTPTPTQTATPTFTPPPPPTDTPLPPPTDTPPPPPTDTPLPPTATATKIPTPVKVEPQGGLRLVATFQGGSFTFRTNPPGRMVTLKEIILNKAECSNGDKITRYLNFDEIKFFPIEHGKFTITQGGVTINGYFTTPTSARGVISLSVKLTKGSCQIGPLPWVASGSP